MAQQVVDDISEGFLRCSICMESYDTVNRKPKMLQCIHSFCLPCLEELEGQLQCEGKLFSCPLCRAPAVLPSSGVKDLPVNFLLISLMERLSMVDTSGDASKMCSFCKQDADLLFCIDCKFHICPLCKMNHDKIPGTGDHTVIPIEKLSDEKYVKEVLASQTPRCNKHREEKLRFYCLSCCQLVCRDCMLVAHRGHDCAEAESQVNGVREKLTKLVEDGKDQVFAARSMDELVNSSRRKMEENVQKVMENISRYYDQLVKSLERDRDLLLGEIQQKPDSLKVVSEEVKNWLRSIANAKEVTEKILEGNNQWEILGMEKDLSEAFKNLLQTKEGLHFKTYNIQQNSESVWAFVPAKPMNGLRVQATSEPTQNKLGKVVFVKQNSLRQMNPYVAEFLPGEKKATNPRKWRKLLPDP